MSEDTAAEASARPAEAFLLALGRALHTCGYPSHRLESILGGVAHRLGLEAQFFSQPTSMFVAFGPQDRQQTFLVRVEPGDFDLGRLSRLHGLMGDLLAGRTPLPAATARVQAIMSAPAAFPEWLTLLAFSLASASVARFLGGAGREILASALLGLITGGLAVWSTRGADAARVFPPLAAFAASVCAELLAHALGGYSVITATLAGLIVLLPGLTLTTAVSELSQRHLASGTSRLTGAFAQFLILGFGVALGHRLALAVAGPPPAALLLPLPPWTDVVALFVSPLALAVLLRADARDFLPIVISGVVSYGSASLGTLLLGPELGLFLAAFVLVVGSLLYARHTRRPSVVTTIPGLIMLVPGSAGFRSVAALLNSEVMPGVEAAFRVILMAVALVAGAMAAALVLPERELPGP